MKPWDIAVNNKYFCWASVFSLGALVFAFLLILNISPAGKDYSGIYAIMSIVFAVLAVPFCYQVRFYENDSDE